MNTPAIFSPCRRYRYALRREWNPLFGHDYVLFIGLNPSTADETQDDPTIRRCVDFAKRWGHSAYVMANLFAWRDTKPQNMKKAQEPVGTENDAHLLQLAAKASRIVAAWGKHGEYLDRQTDVLTLLAGFRLQCLTRNADGSPRHPLYVRANTDPVPYP